MSPDMSAAYAVQSANALLTLVAEHAGEVDMRAYDQVITLAREIRNSGEATDSQVSTLDRAHGSLSGRIARAAQRHAERQASDATYRRIADAS